MPSMQGSAQVPPSSPTGMPPPPPMYGPPPPVARPSRRLPLIIGAVVVIVILLLAATYFLFFASPKPTVQFGTPVGNAGGFVVQVTRASPAYSASSYRVNLLVNGTAGNAVTLALIMSFTVAGDDFQVLWGDLNLDGRLTEPDGFVVTRVSGSLPAAVYTLQLLWSDGSVVGSVTFEPSGSTRPLVTFSSANPSPTGFGFQVAAVSDRYSAAFYEVAFEVNGTRSSSVPLAASMSLTVGADTYAINWTDVESSGDLTGGDAFDVSRAGGLPPVTTFTFYLVSSADGGTIATLTYTT